MVGSENSILTVLPTYQIVGNGQVDCFYLDITATDPQGSSITELEVPLTICLRRFKQRKDLCLGFYDDRTDNWICEDKSLTTSSGINKDFLCGETRHLTNFALLLTGQVGEDDPWNSKSLNAILTWVSMGMVAGAIVIIAVFVLLLEVHVRIRQQRQAALLKEIALKASQAL